MAHIELSFFSKALGRCTDLSVLLPEQDIFSGTEFPVLYLLHGFSDGHGTLLRNTALERYCIDLPFAVIMPDGGKSFYTDMVQGDAYWSYVSEELPQTMSAYFRLSEKREKNFVGGISMGGYGACKLALRFPERYAAAIILSGVVDIANTARYGFDTSRYPDAPSLEQIRLERVFGDVPVTNSENDLFFLVKQASAKAVPLTKLRFFCGMEDFVYQDNLRFQELLKAEDYPAEFTYSSGTHTWEFWEGFLRDGVTWLGQQLV